MAGEAQARGRLHQGLIRPPCRRDETGVMPPTPPGRSAHTRPMRLAPSPWPAEFRRRMEALLGEESAAFFDALSRPRARGMRINPAKTGAAELGRLLQLDLTPVPWSQLGFTFEGIFRQHMIIKGRNRDTAWFAMMDHEWPAVRAGFERWLAIENFDAAGRQRAPLVTAAAPSRRE